MTLKLRIQRSLTRLFIILVSMTRSLFSENMLIYNRCISGLMSNLIKKSWTVSNGHSLKHTNPSWQLRLFSLKYVQQTIKESTREKRENSIRLCLIQLKLDEEKTFSLVKVMSVNFEMSFWCLQIDPKNQRNVCKDFCLSL